jgi:DNA-binding beta-propeller fold protein YncE
MRSFLGSIRPDATPLLSSTLSKVLVAASFLFLSCSLLAQTAHFIGTVSVIASGGGYPQGVAVDANGNVYIADTSNNQVLKETFSAGSYTPSIVASGLADPEGVAVDGAGNVYIADTNNNRVLKETLTAGSYVPSVVVGSSLFDPAAVAVDASGNVYIADTVNNRVLK